MGIAIKSLFSKRRENSGFKRRKKADPRYGDPAFPEFVERRSKPHDVDVRYDNRALSFFREHHQLERKTIMTLGVLVLLAVLLLCSISFVSLAKTNGTSRHDKKALNPAIVL